MKETKNKKSLFKMQIENNKEVHKVMIALNMCGINADMLHAELIMKAIESYDNMGNIFDLETASKIQSEVHDKYEKILNEYKNQ